MALVTLKVYLPLLIEVSSFCYYYYYYYQPFNTGHIGTDGKMYVLDTARVFPPTPPSSVFKAFMIRAEAQVSPQSCRTSSSITQLIAVLIPFII